MRARFRSICVVVDSTHLSKMGDSEHYVVGQLVLVNNKHKAVIKYIGKTNFAEGEWIGLELEREIGKHTGTVLGTTYFVSPHKRGTFVRRENLSPYDAAVEAAAKARKAQQKISRDVTWRAFSTLDADEEAAQLQRRAKLMSSALGARLNRERPDGAALDTFEADAARMVVEPTYDGPHLSWPLTDGQVRGMVDAFRHGKKLHYKYAAALVGGYRRLSAALPTLVYAEVTPGTRMTVCGDTHGQLQDLFSIFTLNGLPSPSNRYLMNGDFVDRGEGACEILLTLFAYALLHPGEFGTARGAAVLLNRGNHESGNQNVTGGFMMEVLDKYSPPGGSGDPEAGLRMYDLLQAAFDCMPLATVLTSGERRVFVVHGGMMQRPGIRLEHIAAVKRKREIPYGLPGFEDKLFEDLMWSDPRAMAGHVPSDRGAGVFFGPDVTERFCALNGISLVLRSHECVPEGYQFMHDGRLLTVFSASRYCGRGTNRGAFVVFEADLSHTVQQYVAGPLEETAPAAGAPPLEELRTQARQYEFSTAVIGGKIAPLRRVGSGRGERFGLTTSGPGEDEDEEDEAAQTEAVRRMLVERICLHKDSLYFFWSSLDRQAGGGGCITKSQWADGMRTVLNLDLPWLALAPLLVEDEADGRVGYARFLDRYHIAMRDSDAQWMEGIIERVCERLFRACTSLEGAFRELDLDGSGVVEFDELERGLSKLDLGLSRSQIVDVMNAIDTDRDGRIQFAEFTARFKEAFARARSAAEDGDDEEGGGAGAGAAPERPVFDSWTEAAVGRVGAAFVSAGYGDNTAAIFTRIDEDGDGLLSMPEFTTAVRRLALPGLREEDITRVAAAVDANASGKINYLEFVEAFRGVPQITAPSNWRPHITDAAAAQLAAAVAAKGALASRPLSAKSTGSRDGGGAGGAGLVPALDTAATSSSASLRSWQRGVIERIVATLYEFRVELAAAFRMFDLDGDGVISRDEFRQGLQALSGLHGSHITDMQADEMLRVLDTNNDGSIEWSEFVNAFKLIDSAKGTEAAPPPSGGVNVFSPRPATSSSPRAAAAAPAAGASPATAPLSARRR